MRFAVCKGFRENRWIISADEWMQPDEWEWGKQKENGRGVLGSWIRVAMPSLGGGGELFLVANAFFVVDRFDRGVT